MDNETMMIETAESLVENQTPFFLLVMASTVWTNGKLRYGLELPEKYRQNFTPEMYQFFRQCMRDPDAALRRTVPVEFENEDGICLLSMLAQKRLDAILKGNPDPYADTVLTK